MTSNAIYNKIAGDDTLKIDIPYSKSEILNLAPQGYDNLKENFKAKTIRLSDENNTEYIDLGKCKKSGYFLPNTLGTVNFYALSCRTDEKFCGKNGLKFENNKINSIFNNYGEIINGI